MCLVLIFIVAVIMYRVLMMILLYRNADGILRSQSTTVASLSASFVNLIIILALSKVYEKLALKLTQWGQLYQIDPSRLSLRLFMRVQSVAVP